VLPLLLPPLLLLLLLMLLILLLLMLPWSSPPATAVADTGAQWARQPQSSEHAPERIHEVVAVGIAVCIVVGGE
jgi:hypothetical protein